MIYYWDIETTGLDAFLPTSRVTMVGIQSEDDQITIIQDESEKVLLERFWQFVVEHLGTYVGFNNIPFDVMYLWKRSIVNNVKPNKKFKQMQLDLRNVLDSDKYAKGSLQVVCMLINNSHKTDYLEGQDVIKLFYDRDFITLQKYLEQDLRLTKILYQRLKDCEVI
jgi:uncharacterized protein YprB with RNaseH-like and TPR domain